MKKILSIILLLPVLVYSQAKRPITIEDLWSMGRISSTTLSPDSRYVAFTLTYYDMEENKGNADIWLVDVLTKELKQITNSKDNETSPCWFPDAKRLAYLAPKDGSTQIFYVDINTKSLPVQITKISTDVNGFTISNDGNKILFVSNVYPDCQTDECNKEKIEAKEKSKVKARIYDELMFRHWNVWRDERRSHLFVFDLLTNKFIDIMQGSKTDCPPIALGGKLDFTFSPEGDEICYVINTDPMVAISTNNNLWLSTLDGKAQRLITTNKGNDNQPIYSPDGKYLLYRSMARAGFEADRQTLMLYNRATGKTTNLTQSLDRSVDEVVWHPNSEDIYFTADNQGRKAIYHLNINSKSIEKIYDKHWNTDLNISNDGNFLIFNQSAVTRPAEIFKFDINSKETIQLTNINGDILSKLELMPLEDFWCKGAKGTMVHTLMVKPPKFDPSKKYPMIFLVHGGPQGAWEDLWHYRWNPQLYAAPGYVVLMPNPRGSTGYGQKFTDEISGDWGGKVYIDLMNVYDYAVKNFKFIDEKRTAAAGASYGGYMMNWIATKTNRFKAIVTHAGVFNLESEYGTTEELWFDEWERPGTPWQNRKAYQKFSPHMYVDKVKTPMLITHGSNDFRVPESQAFELFTSLQRLGVPSRFILFPDETHFVQKPQNFKLWMTEIYKWFERWLR